MHRMRQRQAIEDPLSGLTPQERRIVELIGDGLTNRQIGERLHIADKTVKNNVTSIFDKLNMTRRTQAAALAARMRAESRPLGGRSSGGRSSVDRLRGATSPRSGFVAHPA
jgi:DNA-binding NarL/FixJ family response regulator